MLVLLVTCLVVALQFGLTGPAGAATSATAAGAGQGWRSVTFEHVRIRVPASWPVVSLTQDPSACPRLDRHAVYLGTPGPDPACPARELTGKTEAVQLMTVNRASPDLRAATRRMVIGDATVMTNPDSAISHTIIDIVPGADVEISLSYGRDLSLITAIESSVRLTGHQARSHQATAVRPAAIPQARPQGIYQGPGFDACAAPSTRTMSRWLKSPYRAIGVYIGGVNRGCAQANLTASWIAAIQRQGWHYFPFYVGLQAACVDAAGDAPIVTSQAAAEGTAAAADAAQQAENLGIPPGTPLIYDMEAYANCGGQVITFLSAWDAQLHADGYIAGVYESFSNIADLINAQGQMVEPDVIHYADWDGKATTASSYMPANLWTSHQRLHQFRGGHDERWGGATINVDDDQLDVNLSGLPIPPPGPGPQPTPPFGGPTPPPYTQPIPPYSPPYPFPFPFLFRIAVGQNAGGAAEWFATGAAGTLRHSYQDAVSASGWSRTGNVGDSPANLASNPAVAADQDGRMTVFAIDRTGSVVHAWQQRGEPGGWAWGGAIGSGEPGDATGDPAAIRGPGGIVSVLVTDRNGTVQVTSQQAANDNTGWTPWTAIGGSCASPPVAYATASSPVQVFCITKRGTLAATASAPGGWQPWSRIGTLAGLTGVPAVSAAGPGQLEVVADTRAGTLDTAERFDPAGSWTTGTGPAGPAKVQGAPAAMAWPGGDLAVFSQLTNGQIGYAVQQPAGSTTWTGLTSLGSSVVGVPVTWIEASGTPEAAVLNGKFRIAVASYAPSGWSGWKELAAGF